MKNILLSVFLILLGATSALAQNVPNAKLARGNIIRGNSSGIAKPFDANDSGKILIGDGTDLVSVDVTGDIDISTAGVSAIATGTIVNADLAANVAETNQATSLSNHTSVNFLTAKWFPIFAKSTRAIITEVDTQEDFFYVGPRNNYFELYQDGAVASIVTAWSPSTGGLVFAGDDEADTGWQLTEGILLGSAKSFLVGTDAFYILVVMYLPEIDQHADLMVGFRQLGAYAAADDAGELATAYDRKVLIGVEGAAAALVQYTSINAGTDVGPTTCTGTDPVDGDVIALEVQVSSAGVTSVWYGKAAAAGGSYAQVSAAATTAVAALASDALCNAAAVTLNAATVVVPTIMMASANGTGANTSTLVTYYAGLQ